MNIHSQLTRFLTAWLWSCQAKRRLITVEKSQRNSARLILRFATPPRPLFHISIWPGRWHHQGEAAVSKLPAIAAGQTRGFRHEPSWSHYHNSAATVTFQPSDTHLSAWHYKGWICHSTNLRSYFLQNVLYPWLQWKEPGKKETSRKNVSAKTVVGPATCLGKTRRSQGGM